MSADSKNLAIETMGLTKVFRDFWGHQRVVAVDKLDLQVRSREVFGLLGPNGSGKSTTIKMLLGLLFPTRGVARVLGKLPGDVKTNSRIGYLPEESHLYQFLTARETLDFYGRLFDLSRSERKRRTESLLDMVGLTGVARRPVGEYSKGMMRRIGLAQALINDPDLLILDEPTSGLDPIGTRQIKDLISELSRRGKTVLLCSHLLADVEDVCDRVCILYGGKPQALGSVDELLAHQEMTQINTERLSPATMKAVESAIHAEYPHAKLEVTSPRLRLEQYFLDIVEKAQTSEQQTSGAVMGEGISDFLRSSEPEVDQSESVISQLVNVAAEKTETKPLSPQLEKVEPVEQVQQDVLDSLTKSESAGLVSANSRDEPSEPAELDSVPVEESEQSVDISLIDRLTGNRDRTDNPQKHNDDQSDKQ
ncbi:MAG: ABC transporter ATP-binding protein [Sedimentisphaerales bacterium]|nr:ABC transporter ATP-binding protein [Sedimentisphaerales bacterium]